MKKNNIEIKDNKKTEESAKERLIKNMQELLWERGYVGTSPKSIQERASVGQGSMYHHFSGKKELAVEAIKRTSNELVSRMEIIFSEEKTAFDKIRAYLLYKRDVLKGCRIGRLTQDPDIISSFELREPVGKMLEKSVNIIEQVLEEGKNNNEFDKSINSHTIATTVIAVLQGGYVLARGENSVKAFEEAVSGAIELLESVLNNSSLKK